jgi:hypothetical protein
VFASHHPFFPLDFTLPSDIHAEVALFEERVQSKYIFEFEKVDASSDELMDFDI